MTERFVVFSHGKDSEPWGSKIAAMAEIAREEGFHVESVDYRGIDDPQAAILVLNQPVVQQAQIQSAIAAGFIVRTRSDEPLNADATRFNSALQSNAQIISTDFYHGAPQGIAALQYKPAQVAATAPCISKVGLP